MINAKSLLHMGKALLKEGLLKSYTIILIGSSSNDLNVTKN
ncbi:hypothetical protein SAMN06298216_3171 [Spirosomataceae bacterium TFI 002]|nr:hypothetical protein SAMN06298216_3171 [Spirosomataceae bacterium TFI 002]